MRAFLIAAALTSAVLSALSAPARAEESKAMSQARDIEKRRSEEADRAYKESLKNTSKSEKPVKIDPWSNARDTAPNSGK
jgi:hypothetical protein